MFLKADTEVTVKIGPFVDVSDGVTPETGITLGTADEAELLKEGSSSVVDISGNSWGAITSADGWYWLTLTTTDTNTEGQLYIIIQDDSVCLPVWAEFQVVNANVYDSLFAAATTDYLQVDLLQVNGASSLTELTAGALPATPTPIQLLMALYMPVANKIDVDSSYKEVHNNAGSVIFKKALSDNGTTYSEANSESG